MKAHGMSDEKSAIVEYGPLTLGALTFAFGTYWKIRSVFVSKFKTIDTVINDRFSAHAEADEKRAEEITAAMTNRIKDGLDRVESAHIRAIERVHDRIDEARNTAESAHRSADRALGILDGMERGNKK